MTIELDHIGLAVSDYERAKAFYAAALAPLRMSKLMEWGPEEAGDFWVAGFGADGKPFLWLSSEGKTAPHTHIAIRAETRAQVDAFHAAALAAGGKDNGGPGVRAMYHPNYYGAFVLDPDGHNIEAVCHTPASVSLRSTRASGKAKSAAAKKTAKPAKTRSRSAAKKPARASAGKAAKRGTAKKAAAKKPVAKKTARRGKKKK